MGRWPPRPPRSKFIKNKCLICNRFVEGARIVEYWPLAAKAAQEQIHKEKVLDLQRVSEGGQNSGMWAGGRQGCKVANS